MKFKKPKFWDYNKPNILSYLFFPISLLLTILKSFKNLTTKKKKYSKIKNNLCRKYLSRWNRKNLFELED